MRSFEEIARQFLSSNYTFVKFEADELVGGASMIRYEHNFRGLVIPKQTTLAFLHKEGLRDWKVVWEETYKMFYEEFTWFMLMKYPKIRYRSRKKEIREEFKFLIECQLAVRVPCEQSVKTLLSQSRKKVTGVRPAPRNLRKAADVKIGDLCYMYDSASAAKISNPCIPFKLSEDGAFYSIMYATNVSENWRLTNKLSINSFAFARVYPTELGKTPEEAVVNSF